MWLAQLETPIRVADDLASKSSNWWPVAISIALILLLLFIGNHGIKAITGIVNDHKALQKEYIENLRQTLTATQAIALKYETLNSRAIDLIEEDIAATKESTRKSIEQTLALQNVEAALRELTKK